MAPEIVANSNDVNRSKSKSSIKRFFVNLTKSKPKSSRAKAEKSSSFTFKKVPNNGHSSNDSPDFDGNNNQHSNGKNGQTLEPSLNGSIDDIEEYSNHESPTTPNQRRKTSLKLVKSNSLARLFNLKRTKSDAALSSATLHRRQRSKNNLNATDLNGSNVTVNSSASLKSLRKLFKKPVKESLEPVLPVDPADQCHFEKLYKDRIHLKIFQYFDLKEKLILKNVCTRWYSDVWLQQPLMVHPLFTSPEPASTNQRHHDLSHQQALKYCKLYLNKCLSLQTLVIRSPMDSEMLMLMVRYVHSRSLVKLRFELGHLFNKPCVIHYGQFNAFASRFGARMRSIEVVQSTWNSKPMVDSTVDNLLLMLIYFNYIFTSLTSLSLILANSYVASVWKMFLSLYAKQLEVLSLELRYIPTEYESLLSQALETIQKEDLFNLSSLTLSLQPHRLATTSSPISLANCLQQMPTGLSTLTEFNLSIDLTHFNLAQCDPFEMITQKSETVEKLSVKLQGTNPSIFSSQFALNFASLSRLKRLKHLQVTAWWLNDADLDKLSGACTSLALEHLSIGCTSYVTSIGVRAIAKRFKSLRTLTFDEHKSSIHMDSEHLCIDNDSLILLLSMIPEHMPCLKQVSFRHCRIDPEDAKLLKQIDWFVTSHLVDGNKHFTIKLQNNRFKLILESIWHSKYGQNWKLFHFVFD